MFSECCGLGAEVVLQLLCSVLPVELARDMQVDMRSMVILWSIVVYNAMDHVENKYKLQDLITEECQS